MTTLNAEQHRKLVELVADFGDSFTEYTVSHVDRKPDFGAVVVEITGHLSDEHNPHCEVWEVRPGGQSYLISETTTTGGAA